MVYCTRYWYIVKGIMKNYSKPLVRKALRYYSSRELEILMGATQATVSNWKLGKSDMGYSRGKMLEVIIARKELCE